MKIVRRWVGQIFNIPIANNRYDPPSFQKI